jgi:hypothetical protein
MSQAKTNTRIEALIEAIEQMAIAVAITAIANDRGHDPSAAIAAAQLARKDMAEALREFLTPVLRVVS